MLALPIVGVVDVVGQWLPTHLAGALAGLAAGQPAGEYLRATIATVVVAAVPTWMAVVGAQRREGCPEVVLVWPGHRRRVQRWCLSKRTNEVGRLAVPPHESHRLLTL